MVLLKVVSGAVYFGMTQILWITPLHYTRSTISPEKIKTTNKSGKKLTVLFFLIIFAAVFNL